MSDKNLLNLKRERPITQKSSHLERSRENISSNIHPIQKDPQPSELGERNFIGFDPKNVITHNEQFSILSQSYRNYASSTSVNQNGLPIRILRDTLKKNINEPPPKNFFTDINLNPDNLLSNLQASTSNCPNPSLHSNLKINTPFNQNQTIQRLPNQNIHGHHFNVQMNINPIFIGSSNQNQTQQIPSRSDKFFDSTEFFHKSNYEQIPELNFLKELAIVLEGKDQCSAVGWEGLDFKNGDDDDDDDDDDEILEKIYVTCNHMGKIHQKKSKALEKKEKEQEQEEEMRQELKEEQVIELELELQQEQEEEQEEEQAQEHGHEHEQEEEQEHDYVDPFPNQETLINDFLKDFVNNSINLGEYITCNSLLKIFLSNVFVNRRSINNDLSFKEKDLQKYYHFLFFYLNKLRPKQFIREALGIPNLFGEPKIQQRMERFSNAINYLLESEFYKKYILTKKIEIEIKHQSKYKVHAELKLLDYYIEKHIYKPRLLCSTDPNEVKNKKKISIAPSRLPCIDCKSLFEDVNNLNYPFLFVYPVEDVKVLKYAFYAPNFLINIPDTQIFEGFCALQTKYLDKKNKKEEEKKRKKKKKGKRKK